MARRFVDLIVVCEDVQHRTFAARFLKDLDWPPHKLRFELPTGGSGEQFVRVKMVEEIARMRAGHVERAALGIIDGDEHAPADRRRQLEAALQAAGQFPLRDDPHIAVAIPCRNIETWIHSLNGTVVDETTTYPKLEQPRQCLAAARRFAQMVAGAEAPAGPPSLVESITEVRRLFSIR